MVYAEGTIIKDRYRIVAPLSEGAMGAIFRAVDEEASREVALKVLHLHYLHRQDLITRFEREASALLALRHPNIVAYMDHGRDDRGRPFMVTELIEGYSADQLLRRDPPLELDGITHFVCQLCAALSVAHDRGIVHRDLKWSNVMVTPREADPLFIKLIDFGILKFADGFAPGDSKRLTRAGVLLGTPEYSSPEQILGRPLDGRSDQYSLAIMTYELIAGARPFKAKSKADLLVKHLKEEPLPLSPDRGMPEAYVNAVMRALAKKPDERFASVLYFSRALEAAAKSGQPDADATAAESGWVKSTSGRG